MSTAPDPSFDEWVEYCFTHGYADFECADDDQHTARVDRFVQLEPQLLAGYITRLFHDPAFLADRFPDHQIADAVRFIFGIASEYFRAVQSDSVATTVQVTCFRSTEHLYLLLLDRVCCRRGTDFDNDYTSDSALDSAVFMIWDMGCVETAVIAPRHGAHLVDPCIDVLEAVLRRSRTSTCRMSALHGLGHLYFRFSPDRTRQQNPRALRVQRIIDTFAQRQSLPEWLRAYARVAREGRMQ